jgi:hypothetical protein
MIDQEERLARFRIIVRTVHAVIESSLALMASSVLKAVEAGAYSVAEKEENQLRDRGPSKFVKRARYVIRAYGDLHGGLGGEGRQAIQLPAKIANWVPFRDRIMHPKKPSDFDVSPADLGAFEAVMHWFLKVSTWLYNVEIADTEATYQARQGLISDWQDREKSGAPEPEEIERFKRKLLKTLE